MVVLLQAMFAVSVMVGFRYVVCSTTP